MTALLQCRVVGKSGNWGCHAHGSAWACWHPSETWPLKAVAMALKGLIAAQSSLGCRIDDRLLIRMKVDKALTQPSVVVAR